MVGEGLRDYVAWLSAYDDPSSTLSWRLGVVQQYIGRVLDAKRGDVRVLSLCAGDGRDVIEVLAGRSDADRVRADLLEVDPRIVERARQASAVAGLGAVMVHQVDAGATDSYAALVPADLVLLVGIFGNISDVDLRHTMKTTPQLCASRAAVIWSRGRDADIGGDKNSQVRTWFGEAGFTELDYATLDSGSLPAVGLMRYDGPTQPLVAGQRLFTFLR